MAGETIVGTTINEGNENNEANNSANTIEDYSHNATNNAIPEDVEINYHVLFAYAQGKNFVVDRKCITWMTTVRDTIIIYDLIMASLRKLYYRDFNKRQFRLLNMTANYGGDSSIFWAKPNWSGHINELDPTIHEGLVHNCNEYNALGRWSVNNVDSIKFIQETDEQFDVIYADPPFGDAYETGYCDDLFIGPMNMNAIVHYLFVAEGRRLWRTKNKTLIFKLPYKKYNMQGFLEGLMDLRDTNVLQFKTWSPTELQAIDHKTHKVILVMITSNR